MKLNICCGMNYLDGYVNIDFSNVGSNGKPIKVDLTWNLLSNIWPMEFYEWGEKDFADEIVFREALEHFCRHDGLIVLKKLYEILKPGGVINVTVPPALKQMKILLLQMSNAKNITMDDFFNAHQKFSVWKYHDDLAGATREGSIGDSHLTFYTKEMLIPILEHVGFKILSIDENIHVKATK